MSHDAVALKEQGNAEFKERRFKELVFPTICQAKRIGFDGLCSRATEFFRKVKYIPKS
jgi:hypothetical protein